MNPALPLNACISTLLVALFLFSGCDDDKDVRPAKGVVIGGKEYSILNVGSQTWTTENYAGPGGVSYDNMNSKPEYGNYYSMAELNSITLPAGWRIPTQEDYIKLTQAYGITLPSTIAESEKIKSLISTTHWKHVLGTNASEFNAYPAGYIFGQSPPIDGDIAEFWTSEGLTISIQEAGADLNSLRAVFYQSNNTPDYKFNLRFVKD